jgi:dsDNA-specific endonuclease/ATPase MutS2
VKWILSLFQGRPRHGEGTKEAPLQDDSLQDARDEEFCHELVVDGVLDLHMFRPKDVKHLVPDYLEECRERGILLVRIVHGKGTGTLRRTVHAILSRLMYVESFGLAPEGEGGWGATLVRLSPPGEAAPGSA